MDGTVNQGSVCFRCFVDAVRLAVFCQEAICGEMCVATHDWLDSCVPVHCTLMDS